MSGVDTRFFDRVSLVKFVFQGLNITLLGSLQPADVKTTRGNSVEVSQFHGKTAGLATLLSTDPAYINMKVQNQVTGGSWDPKVSQFPN